MLAAAREQISVGFSTNFFYNSSALTLLARQNAAGVKFGAAVSPDRSGTAALVGGANMPQEIVREVIRSFQMTVRRQIGLTGGIKLMGVDDTWPSPAGTDLPSKLSSVGFRPSQMIGAMSIPKRISRYNLEKGVFGSFSSLTVKEKIEEINQTLAYYLIFGQTVDTTADEWQIPSGLLSMCATSTNPWLGTSIYGYGDTGTDPTWQGNTITTAVTAGLDLVDQTNLSYGLKARGPGINAMFVSLPAFKRYKQEGQSRAAIVLQGNRRDRAEWGITKEAVVYGDCIIQPEPFLANYTNNNTNYPGAGPVGTVFTVVQNVSVTPWYCNTPTTLALTSGSYTVAFTSGTALTGPVATSPYPTSTLNLDTRGYAIGLTTGSMMFATHSDGNWSVEPWLEPYQRGTGAVDALTAEIKLISMLASYQRYNNILFANTTGWN
jgi:hypothetical protein